MEVRTTEERPHGERTACEWCSCSVIERLGQTCRAVKDSFQVVSTAELPRHAWFGLKRLLLLILVGGRTPTSIQHKPGPGSCLGKSKPRAQIGVVPPKVVHVPS